ncbi:hypothetical protein [uncultured Legionella sp.]|uniref:hypothetical protein n=1 Tax=uncultured Legionella sp. TaxID=210934 RepID=UPI00262C9AAF|nr:hypothetical protein [uncultured Legionella sp.]
MSNKLQFNFSVHALKLLLTTKQTKELAYALLTFEQSLDESRFHDFNDALEWGNLQNTYMQYRATMQGQTRELFDSVLHCLYQAGILHYLSTSEIEAIAKYKDLHALNIHLDQFIGVGSNLSSNVLQLLSDTIV